MTTLTKRIVLSVAFLGLMDGGAQADIIYDFENLPINLATNFTDTKGGVVATFDSGEGFYAGAFTIQDFGPNFEPLVTGHYLQNMHNRRGAVLAVGFSQSMQQLQFNFFTSGFGLEGNTLQVQEFLDATLVGTQTVLASQRSTRSYPTGRFTFYGSTYNNIKISGIGIQQDAFGIDNLQISPTSVPEPSMFILGGISGLMSLGYAWRCRKRFMIR